MAGLPGAGESREAAAPGANYASQQYAEDHDDEHGKEAREGHEGGHEEEGMEELHELAVNLLYLLIVLHIAGVLFETRRSGRQVVVAMLPGRR